MTPPRHLAIISPYAHRNPRSHSLPRRGRIAQEGLNPDADFGNFLNTIDGVNDLDNCIVVITTNDLSAIDPAIGRRTG